MYLFIGGKDVKINEKLLGILDLRASIKSFSDQEVSDEVNNQLISCAITAQSSGNIQPWERTKARYGQPGEEWSIIDTSAAIENVLLAAR